MLKPAPVRSLRTMVLDLIESTDLSDPREIADAVLAGASDAERDAMLAAAVASEVRLILCGHRKSPTGAAPKRPAARSAKVRAIRDAWQMMLRGRYSVGGAWKPLAEFTVEDAQAVAAERRAQAAEAIVWAERFDALAKAIADAGAATAGDLASAPAGWFE